MDTVFQIKELLTVILANINDGKSYKNVRLVCRGWLAAVGDRIYEFSNHLWTLIQLYPDEEWDWNDITTSPHTTPEIILKNMDKPFQWDWMHYNRNITHDFISATQTQRWDWENLSSSSIITWDFILAHPHLPWHWHLVCANPNITWDILAENQDKLHNMYYISKNPNITEKIITDNPHMGWDWGRLSHNSNLGWNFILSNKNKWWDWHMLLGIQGKSLTCEVLTQIEDKISDWDSIWDSICLYIDITEEFMTKYEHRINWDYLFRNKSLTLDIIKKNLHRNWKWAYCTNIDEEYVQNRYKNYAFPRLESHYQSKVQKYFPVDPNIKITWRLVQNTYHLGWNFLKLSQHKF